MSNKDIELEWKNYIPVESKLMMAGEIVYATEGQNLTPKEVRTLE